MGLGSQLVEHWSQDVTRLGCKMWHQMYLFNTSWGHSLHGRLSRLWARWQESVGAYRHAILENHNFFGMSPDWSQSWCARFSNAIKLDCWVLCVLEHGTTTHPPWSFQSLVGVKEAVPSGYSAISGQAWLRGEAFSTWIQALLCCCASVLGPVFLRKKNIWLQDTDGFWCVSLDFQCYLWKLGQREGQSFCRSPPTSVFKLVAR